MDWLLAPIDAARGHDVGWAVSWHARLMVFGWGFLAPASVLMARFLKIWPGQKWPQQLDSQGWWRIHWIGQTTVFLLTLLALGIALGHAAISPLLHRVLGFLVVGLACAQVLLGLMRGSKGGPTAPARDGSWAGDHYDLTPRRLMFETVHKSLGYLTLGLAACAILTGLWEANGPRWMWILLITWWVTLIVTFACLQRAGWAIDTYQAIWGSDPKHPGNARPSAGWGMRRPLETGNDGRKADVRSNRGDRVRGH